MTVKVPRETVEKLEATVVSDVDPTGDVVRFAFTQDEDRPTSWEDGQWRGSYDASTGESTAVTPTVGGASTGATVELATGTWIVWVKITDSPEVPVRKCGKLLLQ